MGLPGTTWEPLGVYEGTGDRVRMMLNRSVTAPVTGGWQTWTTVTVNNINIIAAPTF